MNSNSIFKLVIYCINWIKIVLIALPVSAALITLKQGKMKYGYDFLTVDHNWSIVIAIAIGIILNTWHAMAFEEIGNVDPKLYLKMRQQFVIKDSDWSDDKLKIKIEALLLGQPKRLTLIHKDHGQYTFLARSRYGFKDIVTVQKIDGGVKISSRPKNRLAIVDMARNLSNAKDISKHLKEVG
jgi:hypothetical protein